MGHRCCSKQKVKRGLWSPEEDEKLARYITTHGHGCWSSIPKLAGLQRCGKSCRLRWINYLRPDLKRGTFTAEEEQIILDVHRILGNRWAQIAKHLPGRTDNEVKNFWNSCIKKKLISKGLDPKTHNLISSSHHQKHYYSNKTSAARNPSQTQQQSISVFTVDSQDNSIQLENPLPFVVLPSITPLPPPISQPQVLHQTILMPTSEYQNNNTIWTVEDDRNSHDFINFPCTRSSIGSTGSSSLSCPVVNPSGIGFRDENCNWGTCTVETIGAPGQEQVQPQLLKDPHKEKICGQKIDENGDSKGGRDMDTTPFDSCTFDLEFVESTLFSGAMSHDLTSIDDLTWNF